MSLLSLTPIIHATGGAPFTPGSLSNLQLWLEADTGVTKDGSNNVSVWLDQSSNAYSFAGASTKPIWAATDAGINNKPSMTFSGTASFSNAVALLNGTTSSSFTWYIVAKSGPTLSSAPMPMFVHDSSGRGYQIVYWNSANFKNLQMGSSTVYPSVRASADFASASTWYSPSLTYTGTGTGTGDVSNYQFYISNVATTTQGANASVDTATNTLIGNYKTGSTDVSGPIALIVWQTSVATPTERANMATYINTKYGL